MNPETKFSRWLCSSFLRDADIQRLEVTSGSGVPDINFCYNGLEGWIETKIGMDPLLRPYQNAWIHRRHKAGGKVWIFSEYEDLLLIYRPPFTVRPAPGGKLKIIEEPHLPIRKRDIDLPRFLHWDKSHI